MVFPISHNIASLIASYGTDQFEAYLRAIKTVEEMVRRGTKLQYFTPEVQDTNRRSATTEDSACKYTAW